MDGITHEQIFKAIRKAQESRIGDISEEEMALGVTSGEYAEQIKLSRNAAQAQLRRLVLDGTLEVSRGRRKNIIGQICPVPVYRPKEKSDDG